MATFERIDPDGDLNTGRSVFAEAFSMSLTAYDVRSAKQEADWWDWAEHADDEDLLAALHACVSWSDIPAHVTRTRLQDRGYILVGGQPREVIMEREENP